MVFWPRQFSLAFGQEGSGHERSVQPGARVVSAESEKEADKEKILEFGIFSQLWDDEALGFNYLLEEVNIVDDQKNQLKQAADESRSEQAEFISSFYQAQVERKKRFSIFNDKDWMRKQLKVYDNLFSKVNTALLPHQVEELRYILRQRSFLRNASCEAFTMPLRVATKIGMNPDEISVLRKSLEPLAKKFSAKRSSLLRESLKEASDQIPGSKAELFELAEQVNELDRFASFGFSNRPSAISQWTKQEFSDFEEERFRTAVFNLKNSPALQSAILLQDFQLVEIREFITEFKQSILPGELVDPGYVAIVKKLPEGDANIENLKSAVISKFDQFMNRRKELVADISTDVLLEHQVEKLKRIAEFSRSINESMYGDEFGILLAYVKSADTKRVDVPRIASRIDEVRQSFYEELKSLRQKYGDEVLSGMAAATRKKFTDVYGDRFYDYQSERIATWDQLRKNMNRK